jgi:hypothetical protein
MHVVLDGRRTTTSMDNTLATLLSIKLGHSEFDITAVRQWCQDAIDADPGAFIGGALGSRLSHQALLEVATPKLVEAYYRET